MACVRLVEGTSSRQRANPVCAIVATFRRKNPVSLDRSIATAIRQLSDMADMTQRSYLRDRSGPRAVDGGRGRDKIRNASRSHKDGDDREKHRSKRHELSRSPKKESSHRRKVSNHNSPSTNVTAERPSFELHIIAPPAQSIPLGLPVQMSIMISLRLPSSDQVISANSVDTSRLLALTSLVAENRNNERIPLEPGLLSGQKMYDSVQPFSEDDAAALARSDPCRLHLGYFAFPDLLIRQAGTYRIRTTVMKMDASPDSGATSLLEVDSEPIKVERRGTGTPRRHQRVYS